MRGLTTVALLCFIACSTGQVAQKAPAISVKQVSTVSPIIVRTTSAVPVDYNIEIANRLEEPLTLTALEIETVGESGGYSMKRVRHTFSIVIASGDTTVVPIRAWVVPLQSNDRGDITGNVNVRGVATFTASNGVLKTAFANRVQ